MLEEMAEKAGMALKAAYTLREVSKASCIPYGTIAADARDGTLKTFLPPGRKRGRLVTPEWFDEYWERGTDG